MLRHALVLLVVAGSLVAIAPPASACCHVLYYHQDVGPCYVEWRGDGLRLETEYATVVCAGETLVRVGPLP